MTSLEDPTSQQWMKVMEVRMILCTRKISFWLIRNAGSVVFMIGDGLEVDVLGALAAGWDAVFFNPNRIPHSENLKHEIVSLDLLQKIL